jgi:hypothetical protein
MSDSKSRKVKGITLNPDTTFSIEFDDGRIEKVDTEYDMSLFWSTMAVMAPSIALGMILYQQKQIKELTERITALENK